MKTTVFDASAVLALLFNEAGADKVEVMLHKGAEADKPILISAVNWAEVLYRMQRKRGTDGVDAAKRFERTMPLEVAPVNRELAEVAAVFKATHGLALADAFAAALCKANRAELVTCDPDFEVVKQDIRIIWIR